MYTELHGRTYKTVLIKKITEKFFFLFIQFFCMPMNFAISLAFIHNNLDKIGIFFLLLQSNWQSGNRQPKKKKEVKGEINSTVYIKSSNQR
jgi:hypothetical protein